jgi:hypothetical protein
MKAYTLLIFIAFSFNSFAQPSLVLNDNDLINKEDLKKHAGWLKLKVDSGFKDVSESAKSTYEYYVFADKKGFWQFQFPDKDFTVAYKKLRPDDPSKLLNGTVEFYNKKKCLIYRYVFREGFYINIYDYTKGALSNCNDKLISLFEYIPGKNCFECTTNGYNKKGEYTMSMHCIEEGNGIKVLDVGKKIVPLPY